MYVCVDYDDDDVQNFYAFFISYVFAIFKFKRCYHVFSSRFKHIRNCMTGFVNEILYTTL